MIRRNIKINGNDGSKSIDTKIINPEEQKKVLRDLEEELRRCSTSVDEEKLTTNSTDPKSSYPASVRWQIRRDPNARRPGPMKCFIFAIICAIAGILLLFAADYERQLALSSISWPTTQGHIDTSYNYLSSHLNNRQSIRYSYLVNKEPYTSTTLAFNSTWSQNNYDVAKRFPINSTVVVHYCPDNPWRSCLEIGNVNILGQRFYGAVLCFALALWFLALCIAPPQNQGQISKNL